MSDDESLDFNRSPDLKFLETPKAVGDKVEAPGGLETLDLSPAALPEGAVTPDRKKNGISMLQATPERPGPVKRTPPSWRRSAPAASLSPPPGIPSIRSPSRDCSGSDCHTLLKAEGQRSSPATQVKPKEPRVGEPNERRASHGSLGDSADEHSDQGQSSGVGGSMNGADAALAGLSPSAQKASKELNLNHTLPTQPPFSCFLGGIPQAWAEEQVTEFFRNEIGDGPIAIRMMAEKKTGKRKGFCYVDFENQDILIKALYLDTKVLEPDTNPIRVDVAEPPKPKARKVKTPKAASPSSGNKHIRSPRSPGSQNSPRPQRQNGFRSPRNGGFRGRGARGGGRGRARGRGNFSRRSGYHSPRNGGPARNDHRSPRNGIHRGGAHNGGPPRGGGDSRPAHLRNRFFRSPTANGNAGSHGSPNGNAGSHGCPPGMNRRSNPNIFGGAKPREQVLLTRGN